MKLPHLPFFWRLFSAFVICSLIPLFVLAFVVTGVFQQVITRHNELQKKNIIEQIAAITEQSVLEAKQTAITMAASPLITEYCLSAVQNNLFHEAKQSILISDIFQHIRLIEVSGKYQVFIIPVNRQVLSRGKIPEQYKDLAYQTWGIFGPQKKQNGTSLFIQPHPSNGNTAVAAVIAPVVSSQQNIPIGYVVIDILRNGLYNSIASIVNLQSTFDTLIIYDSSKCIMYSHFDSKQEAEFWDIVPQQQTQLSAIFKMKTDTGLTIYSRQITTPIFLYIYELRSVALLLALFTGTGACIAAVLLSKSIAAPILALTNAMHQTETGNFSSRCSEPKSIIGTTKEMLFLIHRFNRMVEKINLLMENTVEQERRLRISEVKALQAQINPHFLYNTLNSIKAMAKLSGNQDIANMVVSLAKLLRNEFTGDKDLIPLQKELENIYSYFEIETYRWPGRFTLKERIDSDILDYPIPRLILQPLVENALLHGLEQKSGPGTLSIQGTLCRKKTDENNQQSMDILISVTDDGCGIPPERLQKLQNSLTSNPETTADIIKNTNLDSNGIALQNTHSRIVLLYGASYGLTIESIEKQGTITTIRIPYQREH